MANTVQLNISTIASNLTGTHPPENSTAATDILSSFEGNSTSNSTVASDETGPNGGRPNGPPTIGYRELPAELVFGLLVALLIFFIVIRFVYKKYWQKRKQNGRGHNANPDIIEMQPVADGIEHGGADAQPNDQLLRENDEGDYIGHGRSLLTPPVSVEGEDDPSRPMLPGAASTQPAPAKEAQHSLPSSSGQSAKVKSDSGFGTGATSLRSDCEGGAGTTEEGPRSAMSRAGSLRSHQGSARMIIGTTELLQGASPFQHPKGGNIQMSRCVQGKKYFSSILFT